MKDFSRRIKTSWDFIAEFFFHRMFTVSGNQRYHVSVKDKEGHTIFFSMEQRGNCKWKIVDAPKVPDWVMEIEPVLNEAILENIAA